MHEVTQASRTTIVIAWLLFAGTVVAQESFADSLAGESAGGRIVAAIQRALSEEGLNVDVVDAVEAITAELYMSVEGVESATPDPDDVCAYLVGTGGTVPRLDGGGEWLSVRPPALQSANVIVRGDHPTTGFTEGVRLVIVDEFNLASIDRETMTALGSGVLDVHATEGSFDLWRVLVGDEFARRGGSTPEAAMVPHGHVVAFHALSHMPLGSAITSVAMLGNRVVLEVSIPESGLPVEVHLLAIEFANMGTISTAMDALRDLDPAVVVMSWGIVDCFVSNSYGGTDMPETLAEYVAERLSVRPQVVELVRELCAAVEVVREEVREVLGQDACSGDFATAAVVGPLAYFAGLNERTEVAIGRPDDPQLRFFAAAGNQGLGFPMPPAAWSGIHAVEACVLIDSRPRLAEFTNRATLADGDDAVPVRALGAWFDTVERGELPDDVLGYWGTSFAAPAAAVHFLASGIQGLYPPCAPPE